MNTTTKRFPRTLQEAFGPYTSRTIYTEYTQLDRADKIVLIGCAVIGGAVLILALIGVL